MKCFKAIRFECFFVILLLFFCQRLVDARENKTAEEIEITEITISNAPSIQSNPGVTWSGEDFFVAWEDERLGAAPDIYGTPVSEAGNVQDLNGLRISFTAGTQYNPAVASDGEAFLTVWDRWVDNYVVFGAVISPIGDVGEGVEISTASPVKTEPHVAWGDGNYLTVWDDLGIYAARVNSEGKRVDSLEVSTDSTNQDPRVAWGDGVFLVIWQSIDVLGVRISPEGQILDQMPILMGSQCAPDALDVAWGSGSFLVVWSDNRAIYGRRLDVDGNVLDDQKVLIASGTENRKNPAVAWNGEVFLVIWENESSQDSSIHGVRVSAEGDVLDPGGFSVSSIRDVASEPDIAGSVGSFLVAWSNSVGDIRGAIVGEAIQTPCGTFSNMTHSAHLHITGWSMMGIAIFLLIRIKLNHRH